MQDEKKKNENFKQNFKAVRDFRFTFETSNKNLI